MKYPDPILVSLDNTSTEKAKLFADAVLATVNYADSGQTNTRKVFQDHFHSKLAEAAVANLYRQHTVVAGPDYNIYPAKSKSWDADLMINNIPVGIKTQTMAAAKKYGLSWTFQSGKYRKDKVLEQSDHWIIFTLLSDSSPYQCLVFPARQIHQLPFKDPVLQKLKGEKQVVYGQDFGWQLQDLQTYFR